MRLFFLPSKSMRRPAVRQLIVLLVLAATTAASPSLAHGQGFDELSPLRAPERATLRCHATIPSSRDSAEGARLHLHFDLVRPLGTGERDDDFWFNASGKAVSMTELITTPDPVAPSSMTAVTALFVPDGRVAGYYIFGAKTGAVQRVRLSTEQGERSRALAEWFWAHRCHQPPTTRDRDS